MIKQYLKSNNLYVEVEHLDHVNLELKELRNNKLLYQNLPKGKRVYLFFNELSAETQRNAPNRKERRVIEAVAVEIMLPKEISKDEKERLLQELHKVYMSELNYVVFEVKRGFATYLRYICSERKYYQSEETIETLYGHDGYRVKGKTGKLVYASKETPNAVCIYKATDVRSTRKGHFGNKCRKFAGSKKVFNHKVEMLKLQICTILQKMNYVRTSRCFPKHDGKSAKNGYVLQNIQSLNKTLEYMESVINVMERSLCLGYMEDYVDDLNKIYYSYKMRAKKKCIRIGKVTLKFQVTLKQSIFQENVERFKEEFETAIESLQKQIAFSVLGNSNE